MPKSEEKFTDRLRILFYFMAALWIVEIINLLIGHRLCSFGIFPRTINGLAGIPLAPFLHNGIMHLAMNTSPVLILGGIVMLSGKRLFFKNTLFIILAGGAALWIAGRSALHVGASGLVFGYFGYIVSRGFFKRDIISILLAVVTIFAYGGIIWGLAPTFSHVSWEGHLCGFAAGILAARIERPGG